jgi:hypothetical protein
VSSGFSPVDIPGIQLFGNTPSNTQVTVSFILQEQNIQSLESQVESGIPSSQYLSVSQFAAEYGQPASNIHALTSYLAGYGIQTDVYADDVDVVATGTVAQFDSALTVTEKNATVPAQRGRGGFGSVRQQNIYTNTQPPLLFRDGHPRAERLRTVRERHRGRVDLRPSTVRELEHVRG